MPSASARPANQRASSDATCLQNLHSREFKGATAFCVDKGTGGHDGRLLMTKLAMPGYKAYVEQHDVLKQRTGDYTFYDRTSPAAAAVVDVVTQKGSCVPSAPANQAGLSRAPKPATSAIGKCKDARANQLAAKHKSNKQPRPNELDSDHEEESLDGDDDGDDDDDEDNVNNDVNNDTNGANETHTKPTQEAARPKRARKQPTRNQ